MKRRADRAPYSEGARGARLEGWRLRIGASLVVKIKGKSPASVARLPALDSLAGGS